MKVYPNPSTIDFALQVISKSNEPISVRVMDLSGQVLSVKMEIVKGSLVRIGSELKVGTYFAEVTQGGNKQVVKLVKLN